MGVSALPLKKVKSHSPSLKNDRFRIIEASVRGGGKVGTVCCGTDRVLKC
jgi:hypothetical protein